jgi:AraC-like DNA-binding protein
VERIREAARLLQDTDLPLKVVAERCGFADANYFGKAFRQHTGVSPGAFRRSGV